MSSPSAPNTSLVPDAGSLSRQQLAKLNTLNLPHFSDVATAFIQSLKELIVQKHYGQYDSVHVLFLSWDTLWGATIKELKDLAEFMNTHLKFTTDYYQIPRADPKNELDSKLEDVVRAYGGANELLIIYYAGHSRVDVSQKTTFLQANQAQTSKELKWSAIEQRLNHEIAPYSNILYILDCCYTPKPSPPSSRGIKQLLAAFKDVSKSTAVKTNSAAVKTNSAAVDTKSAAVDTYSFTADLLHELTEATGPIDVSTLRSRIKARQAARKIPEPYHLALSHKAHSSSIVLCPMRALDPCTPVRLEQSQSVTLCMIQAKVFDVRGPGALWARYIEDSQAVRTGGISVKPVDYVKRYEHLSLDGVYYILVSMPSALSRKIVKEIACGRAFTEFGTYGSEADITKGIRDAALNKARSSKTGRLGLVS